MPDGGAQLLPHAGRRNHSGRAVFRAESPLHVCCNPGIRGDTACTPQSTATRCGVDQRVQGGRRHDQGRTRSTQIPGYMTTLKKSLYTAHMFSIFLCEWSVARKNACIVSRTSPMPRGQDSWQSKPCLTAII